MKYTLIREFEVFGKTGRSHDEFGIVYTAVILKCVEQACEVAMSFNCALRSACIQALLLMFTVLVGPGTAQAQDPSRILLVSAESDGDEVDDPSYFLKAFFDVIAEVEGPKYELTRTSRISDELEQLQKYSIVILNDVAEVSAADGQTLESWVRKGGCVWIICGSRVKPEAWNESLFRDGNGLLPGKFDGAIELEDVSLDFKEAIELLEPLDIGVVVTMQSAMSLSSIDEETTRVWCNYSNDKPAIVEKRLERGTCVLVSTSFHYEWSDLVACPTFVVLASVTVEYLIATHKAAEKGDGKDE